MQTSTLQSVLDQLRKQAGLEGTRAARLALLLTVGLAAAGVSVLASQQEKPKPEPVATARTDLYGDPLPDGALARLGTIRLRHAGMMQVVFSGDGKALFTTGLDNCIRRWEVSSGRPAGSQPITLPADDPFSPPDFHALFVPPLVPSPDAKTVAFSGPKHLFFIDAATGKELHRFPCKDFITDRVTFTADSKQVACRTPLGELLLFDVATGQPLETGLKDQRFNDGFVIALDPSGKQVAAPDNHGNVIVWDVPGGKQLRAIRLAGCRQMVFSPDGKRLLLASSKEAIIWNIATGEKEAESPLADGLYWNLCFSPDGAQLVVSSEDSILLLDTKNLKETRRLPNTVGFCRFQFSPDGKTLAGFSYGKAAHLWNVADGKPLHAFPGHNDVWRVVYSPDGKSLASGGGDVTIIWDLETKKPRTTIRTTAGDRGDKAFIFSADGQTLFGPANFGTVKAWRVADGKEIATYLTADDEQGRGNQDVTSLHVSRDGKRLTACSLEHRHANKLENLLVTWDVPSGKRLAHTSWPGESEMSIAPNGSYLTYSKDQHLVLYDLAAKQGNVLGRYPRSDADCFSADGTLLATPSADPSLEAKLTEEFVSVRETATGKLRNTLPPGTGALNAFTPDGRYLLTTSLTEFRVWEIATGKEVLRRPVDGMSRGRDVPTFARCIAVARDGRSAATSLPNANILIWDLLPSSRIKADLTAKDLESLWADLAGEDAAKAYDAGGRLLSAPDMACAFLGTQLRPATDETERIRGLIEALNDDEFPKRQAARKDLEQFGLLAEAELLRPLEGKPAAETRRVVEALLEGVWTVRSAEERRQMRAVWVLEQVGSADARRTLERLAGGAAAARQTREVKSALQRLKAKG